MSPDPAAVASYPEPVVWSPLTRSPDVDSADRVRGILLGLAAGDRNGGPIQMALRVAESLVEQHRFDSEDILTRYIDWWRSGAFDTGPVAAGVLSRISAGISPQEAAQQVHDTLGGMTAGCNPAHRCPPLAMAAFLPDDDLVQCATGEARLTHLHPLAGDVAAAVAVLCRSLVRRPDWDEAITRAKEGRSHETVAALMIDTTGPLDPSGFAPEVLRAAIRFVVENTTFERALAASIRFAGPANYCPVLVGAIGGARWGASSIPADLFSHCDMLHRLAGAADRLALDWVGFVA